jgi:glutathione synthase/RimK-type ligase-like ATP-grasp enzyme
VATLVVVDRPNDWPLDIASTDSEIEIVAARDYLANDRYSCKKRLRVFNLCRSYRYQSMGYYVSLLAEARGHRPLPNVSAIQDLKSPTLLRFTSDDLETLIQKCLVQHPEQMFELNIYFGQNLDERFDRLALQLFNLFQAPLLRARFTRLAAGKWQLQAIRPMEASEIPPEHYGFVMQAASRYVKRTSFRPNRNKAARYDLAILASPEDKTAPSNDKALKRFVKAAQTAGLEVEVIDKSAYGRVAEFDALFIRETTSVNHHTYRFARRAAAEGLVVIDDPLSILRCTNKVYLAELLERHQIPIPKTVLINRDNLETAPKLLGLPCVLKQPDGSFSQGVVRVETWEQLKFAAERFLEKSDIVVGQEYAPTTFDWRVGIIDRKPLYVCKYYMATNHWQVVKKSLSGRERSGKSETMDVNEAPRELIQIALAAANLIGDGLYGVDIKQFENRFSVIEINDNPSIDSGVEDLVLKDELYRRIIDVFVERLDARTEGREHQTPLRLVENRLSRVS